MKLKAVGIAVLCRLAFMGTSRRATTIAPAVKFH